MKMHTNTASVIAPKSKRGSLVEMSEQKKQELLKLEARIAELENELRQQNTVQAKQDSLLKTSWEYNFNTDSLF